MIKRERHFQLTPDYCVMIRPEKEDIGQRAYVAWYVYPSGPWHGTFRDSGKAPAYTSYNEAKAIALASLAVR